MNLAQRTRLLDAAERAQRNAHAPYSHYRVGAAVLTDGGKIYAGCNVENASYGLTICAERVAVGAALAAGARRVRAAAVIADGPDVPYPCGACRQVLAEFAADDAPLLVARRGHLRQAEEFTLGELLPHAFRLRAGKGAGNLKPET
ncbi:MAG: cytidine deaminase [Kiritimatiellaeota bacterium]|nr:cytidine deaminase [Kiritimatiellota bacterium]